MLITKGEFERPRDPHVEGIFICRSGRGRRWKRNLLKFKLGVDATDEIGEMKWRTVKTTDLLRQGSMSSEVIVTLSEILVIEAMHSRARECVKLTRRRISWSDSRRCE